MSKSSLFVRQVTRALAIVLGTCGVAGLVYCVSVTLHICKHRTYKPVLEDWLFHVVLPSSAYAAFALACGLAPRNLALGLDAVCGATLLLLFVGIHNAWDSVVYHVFNKGTDEGQNRDASKSHRR